MHSISRITLQHYLGGEDHQMKADAAQSAEGRHPPLFTVATAAGIVAACAGAVQLAWQSQLCSAAPAPTLRHQDALLKAFMSCHRAEATSGLKADGCPVVHAAEQVMPQAEWCSGSTDAFIACETAVFQGLQQEICFTYDRMN